MPIISILVAAALTSCTAIDGDTLRCRGERVRLIGIDAPEMPGHCRRGRVCVEGDPIAAKRHLDRLVRGRDVKLTRHGRDHYGRTLAYAEVGGIDLSCEMIASRFAVYVEKWDRRSQLQRCESR